MRMFPMLFALAIVLMLAASADAGPFRARSSCASGQCTQAPVAQKAAPVTQVQRTVTRERRVLIQRPVLRRGCR